MASHIKEDKVASVGYRLAKLLKHLDNRLCADCGVSLLEWQNYYGSLTHQVWLCNTCFETHVEVLGEQGAGGKRIKDEWTDQDLVLMEKAGSNVARNKIYERYPHFDWKKISSESPYTERIQYIKAKYLSHYFTIPPLANPTGGGKKSAHDIGYSSTLPMRTADYFVTLGPGKPKGKLSANKSITDLTFHTEILSSFPNEKFYTDHPSPIPDLLGPMVFPKGLKLSKKEERPYSYTFVLTDTYRVRQFGAVLVVHELMDPKVLQTLMTQRRQSVSTRESTVDSLEQQSLLEEDSKVLYAPKALVMLSHYPFFHLFTRFLEQIYHLSLSSSPLPIERYIANFILELPLPPQGRIAVLFSLPQCQMQISRPPRNQLPMVDFSYRPLFAMLSVDNILAIFACLCQEMSICICSKNIALLTPVQEALLSLLFPFVWQGCYVPVLPNDMVELLHAPVPLLTGMQVDDINETFLDEDPNMRPSGLVIVHLDSDTVHYGADCQPLPLSKSMLPKLRQKLVEHGSAIYQLPEELIILQNADLLYPNDEHMRPMKNFIAAQGVLSSINPGARPAPSVDRTAATSGGGLPPNPIRRISALASTGLRTTTGSYAETDDGASEISTITGSVATSRRSAWGFYSTTPPRPPKEQKYQHVASHNHPAACSLDAGSRQHSSSATGSFFANRRFALDPAYNYQPDLGQTHPLPPGAVDFNAMEIRGAFLRFFVAAFQTYEDYFTDASARNSSSSNKDNKTDRTSKQATTSSSFTSKSVDGVKAATLTKQSLDLTSRPKSQSAAVSSNSNGHLGPVHRTFDNVKFASAQEDAFLKHMVSSQMFANFVSEIIEEPNQPEIKFFNEHIIAKRNRSKFALTKGSTPFLDDSSEDIAQSFTVPGPVTASVPQGRAFAYSGGFPLPDLKQLQVVVAERGLAGTGGAGGYLVREIGQGPEMSRLQRGESPQVMRDRVRLQFGPSMHGMILPSSASSKGSSLNTFRRTAAGFGIADSDIESDSDEQEDEVAENVFFMAARRRFEAVLRGIIRLQACIRARPARRRLQKVTQARKLLQHWWLGMKLRQAIHRRIRRRLVVRLQTAMRLLLYRRRFLRILHSIRVLQSLTRTRRLRNIFRIQRTSCQKVQAWVRGTRIRREFHKKVKSQWVLWRRQLQYLWTADCTPLKYRSSFWTLLSDSTSLVVQALYQQELRRLYDNLSIFTGANANSKTATFAEQFRTTQGTSIMLKLSALHTSTQHTAADIVTQTVAIVDESMRGQAKLFQIHENRRALAAERKLLYTLLRDDHNNTVLFRLFSLQDLKKRKQKLSDLVWVCCNDDYAAKSATAVKAIYSGNIPAATAPGKDTSTLSSSKNIVTQAAGRGLIVAGEVDWPQLQLERRIAAHCAEAAKGLVAMAEQHKKRRHTLSIT